MSDDEAATKEDSASRKRRRKRNKGSKSCCEECCESCHNMAASIAEMKAKLDSVLSSIEDIKELKQKQTSLEENNKQLEASLEFAHTSTKELREKMAVQDEEIDELKKGVKSLTNKQRMKRKEQLSWKVTVAATT
ncbi:unnamed protein product [Porites lobata]|uniref:Uncharacterized protein n=1 Tax=Porites lobata TaxID=104759 RepID=A0ABN8PIK5_9CNID|nr:unnamed protein product [Porites lobata]